MLYIVARKSIYFINMWHKQIRLVSCSLPADATHVKPIWSGYSGWITDAWRCESVGAQHGATGGFTSLRPHTAAQIPASHSPRYQSFITSRITRWTQIKLRVSKPPVQTLQNQIHGASLSPTPTKGKRQSKSANAVAKPKGKPLKLTGRRPIIVTHMSPIPPPPEIDIKASRQPVSLQCTIHVVLSKRGER